MDFLGQAEKFNLALASPPALCDHSEMENRIKALRSARKMTQAALAERAGTTQAQINKLEKGERRLTTDWMARLGRARGVPPAALIEDREPEALPAPKPEGKAPKGRRASPPNADYTQDAAAVPAIDFPDLIARLAGRVRTVPSDDNAPRVRTGDLIAGKLRHYADEIAEFAASGALVWVAYRTQTAPAKQREALGVLARRPEKLLQVYDLKTAGGEMIDEKITVLWCFALEIVVSGAMARSLGWRDANAQEVAEKGRAASPKPLRALSPAGGRHEDAPPATSAASRPRRGRR